MCTSGMGGHNGATAKYYVTTVEACALKCAAKSGCVNFDVMNEKGKWDACRTYGVNTPRIGASPVWYEGGIPSHAGYQYCIPTMNVIGTNTTAGTYHYSNVFCTPVPPPARSVRSTYFARARWCVRAHVHVCVHTCACARLLKHIPPLS